MGNKEMAESIQLKFTLKISWRVNSKTIRIYLDFILIDCNGKNEEFNFNKLSKPNRFFQAFLCLSVNLQGADPHIDINLFKDSFF